MYASVMPDTNLVIVNAAQKAIALANGYTIYKATVFSRTFEFAPAGYNATRQIVKDNGLVTVCEEAACPNIGECWTKSHATMMIMGDTCTRACAFCNVATGLPGPLDPTEPERVARLGLEGDRGVVELQLVERVAQLRQLVAVDGVQPAEHHRLGVAVPRERLDGGLLGVGDRLAVVG